MSRSFPEWVRSVFFFPPSRTRPRLQADIRWWKERLTALSNPKDPDPKHKKAHKCGDKLLKVAEELLKSDKDTSSLESVLTALRLVSEVRICEIDLLSSENQQIRRDALLADN